MDIESKIKNLEIQAQISNIHPLKIVGGLCAVSFVAIVVYIFWYKPSYVCDDKGDLNTSLCIQFVIAILVLFGSIGYLVWSFFQN